MKLKDGEKMKVSIILPTYNAEKTIDRCIQSIIDQTETNWELICCDDCSTDRTFKKLYDWSENDPRIHVYKNKVNSGAAFTRNECIKYSNGEYIMQIDDDDYCKPDRLKKQLDFLENNLNYDFVGSQMYFFDEYGIWKTTSYKEIPKEKDFLFGSAFANPSIMFRKSALNRVNGYRVARETRRGQDYDLFMRLYANQSYGYNIQEPLTYYYRGKNSYPKCKYRYRIDEGIIRYKNFKNLGLLPMGILYVIKPLIIGIIPISIVERIKLKLKK